MIREHLKVVVLSIVAIAAITIAGFFWGLPYARPTVPDYLKHMGGDFTLQSADGAVSLHDFHGDITLVYFGYTHCPDACPAALSSIAAAMRVLPSSASGRVHGIFISVDPQRDTPSLLKRYTEFFDHRIVGVTGTADQIAAIAADWRIMYSIPEHHAGGNYAVGHSTFIYMVSPEGKIVDLFSEKTTPDDIARAIRAWL